MIKHKIIYNPAVDWRMDLLRAKDSFLWDRGKKRYIDFSSGWNVANLGWNNPEVVEALIKQARVNTYTAMELTDIIQEELAEKLTSVLPQGLDVAGRTTGGTESNEEALKTARVYTGRKKIIGFRDTYHGQSFGAMSIGYRPEYVQAMAPMVGGFIQIDFPQTYRTNLSPVEVLDGFTETLEKLLKREDVAAIVTEAGIITGWGSTYVAPVGYLKLVRKLTKKYGALMILDEVGTGFSRCGKLFGLELESVIPDIVTFAKGLSNGSAAIGAMITSRRIAEKTFTETNLTSTFGWNPVACAVAKKTIEIHLRDRVWEKAARDGKYLIDTLRKELKDSPVVGDIRGIGMEIGIDLVKDKETKAPNKELWERIISTCQNNGLFVSGGDSVIQLMPPLTIDRNVLDQGMEILINTIRNE